MKGVYRSQTPEYRAWKSMIDRCFKSDHHAYKDYGGRGISVCERWVNSFESFLQDMGIRPSDKHTLDRLENDGSYEPNNCGWRTMKEQSNNRRSNVYYTHNGITKNISAWADYFGIRQLTLGTYLLTHSFDEAFYYYSKPPKERIKYLYSIRSRKGTKNKAPIIRFDLVGKRFGALTIVKFVRQSKMGSVWECACDCGNKREATTGKLHEERIKSCGCKMNLK